RARQRSRRSTMKLRISMFPVLFAAAVLMFQQQCPMPKRVNLSTTSLTFAPRVVGSTASAAQSVTLTNVSAAGVAVTITGISASGMYSQTDDCPATLPSGTGCHIQVTFAPNTVGKILGAVTIGDNALGQPQVVNLSGTGITPVALSPGSLSF